LIGDWDPGTGGEGSEEGKFLSLEHLAKGLRMRRRRRAWDTTMRCQREGRRRGREV